MREKNAVIGILLAAIMIMAVGYAAFATNLVINGTAQIASEWKVVFTDITQVSKTDGVGIKETPTASGTTATFYVELISPGDKIEYRITVANQGNLDAVIESINASETGNDAINFEITNIKTGDILLASATTSFNVIISYDENVTTQPEKLNNKLTVNINYVQNLGQDIDKEEPEIVEKVPTADNLYGVWIFNETLTGLEVGGPIPISELYEDGSTTITDMPSSQEVNFTSNSINFTTMNHKRGFLDDNYYFLYYDETSIYYQPNGWTDSNYRTVDFGTEGQVVSQEFFEWLSENAVYQG